jgi:Txe/YoeB family toxin of Txe-Axe toxin-antitoxin module
MKRLIYALLILLVSFTGASAKYKYAQGIDPQVVVAKSNAIARNIYQDILKIKDKYEELEGFGQRNFKAGRVRDYERSCYGYCAPFLTANIDFGTAFLDPKFKRFWLDLNFSEYSCGEAICTYQPDLQIYLKDVGLYLSFTVGSTNDALKNELMAIVKKRAAGAK